MSKYDIVAVGCSIEWNLRLTQKFGLQGGVYVDDEKVLGL